MKNKTNFMTSYLVELCNDRKFIANANEYLKLKENLQYQQYSYSLRGYLQQKN